MLNDLRYAVRMLLKSPGFTVVAVLTLAIGIGLCTTVFSAVNPILFRPLPFKNPGELVYVSATGNGFTNLHLSYADFLDLRSQNHVFSDMGVWAGWSPTMGDDAGGDPQRPQSARVSATLFAVLGVDPISGRQFVHEDESPGAARVVLISHTLWLQRFGGGSDIVGRSILVDSEPATIVGVMPPEFGFPGNVDLWSPLIVESPETRRGSHSYAGIARLKPNVTFAQARQDLVGITDRLSREFPASNTGVEPYLRSLRDEFLGSNISIGWTTLIAVGFVLAVACVNVANLFLARALGRQREFAIRAALGAGRWQTIRQLLAESLLLAVAAGALGFALSGQGLKLVLGLLGDRPPSYVRFDVDWRVLAFTVGVSLLTCLLFGLAPAWHAAGISVQEGLKGSGSSAGHGRGRTRLRNALVGFEVALAMLLLGGAGLMIRTVVNLQHVPPGFNPKHLLLCSFDLPARTYSTPERRSAFYAMLIERLTALPGVEGAGAVSSPPMGGSNDNFSFLIEGEPAPPSGRRPSANTRVITPGYLAAMRIPVLRGRDFTQADVDKSAKVAIVDDAFARTFFSGQEPIGKRITLSDTFEIVGVVGNVKHLGLDQGIPAGLYLPHRQNAWSGMSIVVRSSGDNPLSLLSSIRAAVREMDPELAFKPVLMDAVVERSFWVRTFLSQLFGGFSVLALSLAGVGIAAVVAYSVTQRTNEIGIRMAVGAGRSQILRLVVAQGMVPVAIGLAVGLLASLGLTRVLSSQVYGVGTFDPVSLGVSTFLFIVVALFACLIPARRAARVDPLVALRGG